MRLCLFLVRCVFHAEKGRAVVDFFADVLFFFKQKTAYEMRIGDWGSYVCSSDLRLPFGCHVTPRRMVTPPGGSWRPNSGTARRRKAKISTTPATKPPMCAHQPTFSAPPLPKAAKNWKPNQKISSSQAGR